MTRSQAEVLATRFFEGLRSALFQARSNKLDELRMLAGLGWLEKRWRAGKKRRERDRIAAVSRGKQALARAKEREVFLENRKFEPRFVPRNRPRSTEQVTLSPNLKLSQRKKERKAAIWHGEK